MRRYLGLDSTNSHKPPSSDGYQKKTVKPGLPKEGKRAHGGQVGHQGNTLKRVAQPDYIQLHLPERCPCCGRFFRSDEAYPVIHSRPVFDVPEPKPEVTEHRLGPLACCGVWQGGEYPAEVTAVVQYGAGVRAWVTKLSVDHKMPLEQISQLFEDLYGYDLNSATIEEALERGYTLAESVERQVIGHLLEQQCISMKMACASRASCTGCTRRPPPPTPTCLSMKSGALRPWRAKPRCSMTSTARRYMTAGCRTSISNRPVMCCAAGCTCCANSTA
ncbi:hypothetical protein BN874_2530001 [Candidatus Contendobacter odensis Run_B_J11]|uniref:DUF6444 domain-containing protein n=1 Tax=Candidatus Contendobacter odensis Run_B_J11 TaxID=1400861 RepID=A0A7U7J4P4_9GAMM|nr:hypothetical protein BN874_2530001 [Candidatus Contendobacter odensis Run_B_J11]